MNEEEEEKSKKNNPKNKRLSRYYRLFLYFIILSVESIMNVSGGLLSSASKNIKESLEMSDTEFGMFGPSNSFGRVLGSLLFIILNQKYSRKWILVISISIKSLMLICFKLTNKKYILIGIRFFIGFTHMPATNYCPVWINQFGLQSYKNIQMSAVHLVQHGGKSLGYLLHIIVGKNNWQMGFVIEGFYLLFVALCYMVSSEDFFSRVLYPKKVEENNNSIEEKNKRISCTIFEEDCNQENSLRENENKQSFFDDFLLLSKNKIFLLCLLCRCVIFGLNTGLHFWFSDFMQNVIKLESSSLIFTLYTFICLAGPLGGLLVNIIIKPYIKSYDTRNASWPLVGFQILASIFGISFTFMRKIVPFMMLIVCYLIFNSGACPILQGILVTSVENRLSATAVSITSISTQIIISGTAPVLYGYINDLFKEKLPSLAMFILMLFHGIIVPFLSILAFLRNKKFDEENTKNQEIFLKKSEDINEKKNEGQELQNIE